jgi:hypothetical protein
LSDGAIWPWVTLFLLGTYHGINPGMGWLFAVALGMQERSRRAVWWSLLPITLGHALAIGVVILLAALVGRLVPLGAIRYPVAGLLVTLGIYRLYRQSHPRGGGMRVGMAGLTLWSFLMASAHGAGFMVLPVVMELPGEQGPTGDVPAHAMALEGHGALPAGVGATLIHTLGYLLMTALAAALVYEKLGVAMLRKAWVNLDLIWAIALIITGVLTLFVGRGGHG